MVEGSIDMDTNWRTLMQDNYLIVLYYQLFIAGVVLSRALYGQQALNRTGFFLGLWTATHFLIPWLMLLQFGVIAISYFLGRILARPI